MITIIIINFIFSVRFNNTPKIIKSDYLYFNKNYLHKNFIIIIITVISFHNTFIIIINYDKHYLTIMELYFTRLIKLYLKLLLVPSILFIIRLIEVN